MLTAIAQRLLNAAQALGAFAVTPRAFRWNGCVDTTHVIHWDAGVSSGEVTIETAISEEFAGQWSPLLVVPFVARVPGVAQDDSYRIPGNYRCFKHRITKIVLDGNVTTWINGTE